MASGTTAPPDIRIDDLDQDSREPDIDHQFQNFNIRKQTSYRYEKQLVSDSAFNITIYEVHLKNSFVNTEDLFPLQTGC